MEYYNRIGLARDSALTVRGHVKNNPDLSSIHDAARYIIKSFSTPSFYEISARCNLKCEGCYYFDPETFRGEQVEAADFDAAWPGFLESERARGVTMPYFLGAEPALEQRRLVVASRYFQRANLGTNGTVFLDPEIPYRISISAWAASAADDAWLRGGSALRKALRLYQGDRRTIVLYTVNATNIDQVPTMVQACRDHGLPLTFSLWSPTSSLLARLHAFAGNDDAFFRISTPDQSLMLGPAALERVRDTLGQALDDFPDTVIYSHAYNRWSTRPGPLYTLSQETGIAEECGSRTIRRFRYHGMDLRQLAVKCCSPAMDCAHCRMYSGGWSSQFSPRPEQLATLSGFADWLDMVLTIGRIFLRPEIDPGAFVAADWRRRCGLEA